MRIAFAINFTVMTIFSRCRHGQIVKEAESGKLISQDLQVFLLQSANVSLVVDAPCLQFPANFHQMILKPFSLDSN